MGFLNNCGTFPIAKNNLTFDNIDDYFSPFDASSTNNAYSEGSDPALTAWISPLTLPPLYSWIRPTTISASKPARRSSVWVRIFPLIRIWHSTTDIQNQTRTIPWDIGADEFISLVISDIATSSVYSGQATVTWTTDNLSTSTVRYGLASSYGLATSSDYFVTEHSARLMNLAPDTTYHFQVISTDAYGVTATSSDYTFTTGQVYNIYYSVGQNTNDHKTGTPTISITDGVATFSEAQTAANMGVGDKIS